MHVSRAQLGSQAVGALFGFSERPGGRDAHERSVASEPEAGEGEDFFRTERLVNFTGPEEAVRRECQLHEPCDPIPRAVTALGLLKGVA